MANQTRADDARTDTERHTDDVDAQTVIEGDRISRDLVARNPDQLGQPIQSAPPEVDAENPDTQLVAVTAIRSMDDVHSAILVDPETGTLVRAGRHDRNQAWTQAEADWTVRAVGTSVVVDEVHELATADSDDPVEDDHDFVSGWVDVLFGDLAAGHFDYSDERRLNGSTLTLEDFDGRRAVATISLE